MEPIDSRAIELALAPLGREAQLAFGLSCCERLFPNYLAFTRETGWGTPEALRSALDLAWSALEGATPASNALSRARQAVQDAEAETEAFDTVLVSSALDAATCAGLVLRFIDGGDIGKIVEIASSCRDTVDMLVQAFEGLVPSDPDIEQEILRHRLMQAKLRRQQDDLLALATFSATPTEVVELRERWRSPDKSNIDQSG